MEALTKLAVMTIGPVVDVLESLSFIGVNTHIVKLDAVVSFALCYFIVLFTQVCPGCIVAANS